MWGCVFLFNVSFLSFSNDSRATADVIASCERTLQADSSDAGACQPLCI